MRNYVQPGKVITLTAPMGGVVPGQGVLIGTIFVLATSVAAAGAEFEGEREGVYDLDTKDSETYSEGDEVYFNPADSSYHNHDGGGLFAPIGGCVKDCAASDTAVRTVLWGVPVPPVTLES